MQHHDRRVDPCWHELNGSIGAFEDATNRKYALLEVDELTRAASWALLVDHEVEHRHLTVAVDRPRQTQRPDSKRGKNEMPRGSMLSSSAGRCTRGQDASRERGWGEDDEEDSEHAATVIERS